MTAFECNDNCGFASLESLAPRGCNGSCGFAELGGLSQFGCGSSCGDVLLLNGENMEPASVSMGIYETMFGTRHRISSLDPSPLSWIRKHFGR